MVYEAYGDTFKDLFEMMDAILSQHDTTLFAEKLESIENLDIRNEYGWNLLHLAVRRNDPEAVEMLLSAGADIDIRDDAGWTPLMEAILHEYEEIVSLLLEKGANKNILNRNGESAEDLSRKLGLDLASF